MKVVSYSSFLFYSFFVQNKGLPIFSGNLSPLIHFSEHRLVVNRIPSKDDSRVRVTLLALSYSVISIASLIFLMSFIS